MIPQNVLSSKTPRPMLIAALCLALVVAGTVPNSTEIVPNAQAANTVIVVPNAQASIEGNTSNGFPFNITNFGVSSQRYQQVYAASAFATLSRPMLITELRFRPDPFFGRPFVSTLPDIQINLSTTQRAPDGLSFTFANNVGPNDTVVYARGPLSLSSSFTGPGAGPKAFDIVIQLTTPFLYDASQGNLLLDVRNFGGGTTAQFDAHNTGLDAVSRSYSTNIGAVNSPTASATDTWGLVTSFNFVPANTPPVAACRDITIPANNDCQATITPADVDNGSSDQDAGDAISFGLDSAGPFGVGSHQVTLTVTDDHDASSSCQATVTVVDATPPAISCPANIVMTLPPNTTAIGTMVDYPTPTATDNCSVPTVASSPDSGSVFPVGTMTVNATATDGAGGESACNFTVTVLYNFSGFFQPVDNLPVVNAATAGSAIPVKFSLSGNKGLNILSMAFSQQVSCVGGVATTIEETVAAGGSSLSYDATLDQYIYVWKTDKSWKGTCRLLIVKLNDGTTHVANFQFK